MAQITGTPGNDDLLGTQGDDLIHALAGNDRVLADPVLSDAQGGDDVVYAGPGDDQVYAMGGANRVYGEDGRDTLITADGNDYIDAGPGDDPDVQAGRGNDRVHGGSGDDTLLGGAGADTLEGRTGKDHLTGGGDADRFKLGGAGESGAGAGRDVVLDMTGIDRIDLSAIDPGAAGGDQTFVWLGQSANAGPLASGSMRALDLGSTVIVQANSDADAAIDLEVELRNFTATLVRDDFLL